MTFNENVGMLDRTVRILAGFALIGVLVAVEGPVRWIGLLGLVLLATAVFSFCPLYTLLGLTTRTPKQG